MVNICGSPGAGDAGGGHNQLVVVIFSVQFSWQSTHNTQPKLVVVLVVVAVCLLGVSLSAVLLLPMLLPLAPMMIGTPVLVVVVVAPASPQKSVGKYLNSCGGQVCVSVFLLAGVLYRVLVFTEVCASAAAYFSVQVWTLLLYYDYTHSLTSEEEFLVLKLQSFQEQQVLMKRRF